MSVRRYGMVRKTRGKDMDRIATILCSGMIVLAAALPGVPPMAAQTSAPPASQTNGMDHMPTMEKHEARPATPSSSLTFTMNGKTATLSMADLQGMPQRTLTVHNGHSNVDETYAGVGLSDLLAKYGMTLENGGAAKVYHSYVKAEGTDHYWVLYSASELAFGLHIGDSVVALSMDGKPLGAEGAFKMVSADEKKPARWVRNLQSLTVVTLP